MKNTVPLEIEEQKSFVYWLRVKKILFFTVPNGQRRTRWEAARAKAEGMVAGAPDLIVCLDNGVTLFVEMKRKKGGTVSPHQKAMGSALEGLKHRYKVCRGVGEAIEFVEYYL